MARAKLRSTPVKPDELHYTFKVTLRSPAAPVWRRVRVPGSISLALFQDVLQTALGWFDGYGHLFRTEHERWGAASPDAPEVQDEDAVDVAELVERAPRFVYDLGRGREHDVVFEALRTGPIGRICLGGEHFVPDLAEFADRPLDLDIVENMLRTVARDWTRRTEYEYLPNRKVRELAGHVDFVCRKGPRTPVALPAESLSRLVHELIEARAIIALNESAARSFEVAERRSPRRRPRAGARKRR